PVLADGVHTVVASETDTAGNVGTASLSFTLDTQTTIPIFTAEYLSGNNTNNYKLTLSGMSEAKASIIIYDNNLTFATATASDTGTWSTVARPVSDGVHYFRASTQDPAGNFQPSGSGYAILGGSRADTLGGSPDHDVIVGNLSADTLTGNAGADT